MLIFCRFYVSGPSYVVTISRRYAAERPSWNLPEMLRPDVGWEGPKCWNMFHVDDLPRCWKNMFNMCAEP